MIESVGLSVEQQAPEVVASSVVAVVDVVLYLFVQVVDIPFAVERAALLPPLPLFY